MGDIQTKMLAPDIHPKQGVGTGHPQVSTRYLITSSYFGLRMPLEEAGYVPFISDVKFTLRVDIPATPQVIISRLQLAC